MVYSEVMYSYNKSVSNFKIPGLTSLIKAHFKNYGADYISSNIFGAQIKYCYIFIASNPFTVCLHKHYSTFFFFFSLDHGREADY